jgi:hypothetical protein
MPTFAGDAGIAHTTVLELEEPPEGHIAPLG